MTFMVMVPRHPYRTPSKLEAGELQPERTTLADLDAEIVMFFWSSVVIAVGILRWELGAPQALAMLGALFSGRHLVRAAFERLR